MNLTESEKDKYQFIWTHSDYRHSSPGEISAKSVIENMKPESGASINDYGAGTGRASQVFKSLGLNPTCIDIAKNSVDEDLPFIEACLWDLSNVENAEYGYCCDVMEHIPPEKVDDVLDQIRQKTNKLVYFQIAHFTDVWHGKVLHLTVKPTDWWLEKLKQYFDVIDTEFPRALRTGYYCKPLKNIDLKMSLNISDGEVKRNIDYSNSLNLKQIELVDHTPGRVAVVGGGPSLKDTYILLNQYDVIVSTNKTHDWLIDKGIKPDACVILDGKEHVKDFINNPQADVKYYIGSKCNPGLFDKLRDYDVTVIHEILDLNEPKDGIRIGGGSTVGLKSMNIFAVLGYKDFTLFGLDSCLSNGEHHAYTQKENDNQKIHEVTCKGEKFYCHGWMIQQAEEFKQFLGNFSHLFRVYVVGEGLLAQIVKEDK